MRGSSPRRSHCWGSDGCEDGRMESNVSGPSSAAGVSALSPCGRGWLVRRSRASRVRGGWRTPSASEGGLANPERQRGGRPWQTTRSLAVAVRQEERQRGGGDGEGVDRGRPPAPSRSRFAKTPHPLRRCAPRHPLPQGEREKTPPTRPAEGGNWLETLGRLP